VLDAHSADGDWAGHPVSERCAAVAREIIDKSGEDQRMGPVEAIRLLLRTP
jgi:hypothetical protein